MNIIRLIKRNTLFKNFEDREINKLFDNLQCRLVKHPVGKIIATEGNQIDDIGILISGTLLKFITKPNGTKDPQGTIEPGGMFGEIDAMSTDKKMHYSVLTADEVTILYLSRQVITSVEIEMSPYRRKLIDNYFTYLADAYNGVKKDSEFLLIKKMRLKIAKLIYEKYLEQGTTDITLGFNRNEMAEYLNASRPSMSREMINMRNEGMFTFRKDKISIKNVDALAEIIRKYDV